MIPHEYFGRLELGSGWQLVAVLVGCFVLFLFALCCWMDGGGGREGFA